MRLAALADLHGYLPRVPASDILLIAGDVCPDDHVEAQAAWLDTQFRRWLEGLAVDSVVAIAGNHDFVFQQAPVLVAGDLPWQYLVVPRLGVQRATRRR